jgi:hypothetical protein
MAALLAVAIGSSSLVAFAEPTAAQKETARTLMKEGRTRREKGDHKGALEAFTGADEIMRVPTTGFEVGKEQLELGMLVEARDTFLRVSRVPEEKGEPAPFAEARKQAKDFAAQIEPRIPTLEIKITAPDGAEVKVTIDGNPVPKAALALPHRLNPGAHEIVAMSGAVKRKATIELKESETKETALDLTPTAEEAAAPPPPPEVEPKPEKPEQPIATGGTSTLTWVGFGVAGAGVIAGSITGFIAMSKTSSAKDQCDGSRCPPSTHDDLSSARSMATISTISFIVAGVGIGVGVYGLVSSGGSKPATATGSNVGPFRSVTAVIGPGSLGLTGNF